MPLTPTQKAFLAKWLKKQQKKPVRRRNCNPSFSNQKEPVERPTSNPTCSNQKDRNPKWKDDEWFEKQYGDPDYYKRVKGLD